MRLAGDNHRLQMEHLLRSAGLFLIVEIQREDVRVARVATAVANDRGGIEFLEEGAEQKMRMHVWRYPVEGCEA